MAPLWRRVADIKEGTTSLGWWRDRVFVPYVVGPLTRLHPSYPGYAEAINVMDRDWDNLLVLDACRADVFEAVMDTDIFDDYARVVSLGSHSSEWTRRTFGGNTFDDTVYVSMNPHTSLLADDTFHDVIEVWRKFESSPNSVDPSEMVAAAIDTHEQYPDKRLVVHFMQPHGTGGLVPDDVPREESYRRTTAQMGEVVFDLHDRIGGKTAITADHGELFSQGLRAMLGIDQHKANLRIPELVYVPWAVIEGPRRTITAGGTARTDASSEQIKERLRDLGYH